MTASKQEEEEYVDMTPYSKELPTTATEEQLEEYVEVRGQFPSLHSH